MRPIGEVVLCALLIFAGPAHAQEGSLTAASVQLDGQVTVAAADAVAYVNDTAGAGTLTITASHARVFWFDATFREILTPLGSVNAPIARNEGSFEVTTASITLLDGDQRGWIGIYPSRSMTVKIDGAGSTLEPEAAGRLGNSPTAEDAPNPATPSFSVRLPDHVLASGSGSLRVDGDGAMKIKGLDLMIESSENTTEWRTGPTFKEETGTRERTERWVFLELREAHGALSFRADESIELGFAEGTTSCAGTIAMRRVEGVAVLDGNAYSLAGNDGGFTGELQGLVSATTRASQPAIRMILAGDVDSSSFQSRAIAPAPATPGPWIGVLAVGLVFGVLAGAGIIHGRMKRREGKFEAEDYSMLAQVATESGQHQEALDWTRRALAKAPTSERLKLDEAFHLAQLGRIEEALEVYGRAASSSTDGQAELDAAFALASMGRWEEADRFAIRSLAKAPLNVMEVEDLTMTWDSVSAELRHAIEEAHRVMGE